jgi:uncharacterized protein (DUF58 family)
VKPTRLLLVIAGAWALLGLLSAFFPDWRSLWLPAGIVMAVAATVDALAARKPPAVRVERQLSHNLPVDSWSTVRLIVRNVGRVSYQLAFYDLHPATFDTRQLPLSVQLRPQQFVQLQYRVLPTQRGDAEFSGTDVQVVSRLKLWQRRKPYANPQSVKVYPNFSAVAKYALLATDNQLSLLGIRQRQRRGQGLEFHQLREYREGDTMRQIDWKATSRYRKLISREYQDERDQQIVFLIDCGRRMRAQDKGINHFDQCLNAMLLLSYVALRQGDAVSFMAFGGQYRRFSSHKGINHINAILNQTYDLQTTLEVSDYTTAARELLGFQRKRSLVVVLTNARDEDQDNLLKATQLLIPRHLVLIANLREAILNEVINEPVDSFDEAIRYASVVDYLSQRSQNHTLLSRSGAIALDVTAAELPIAVVNRYLDIKQSSLL